MMLEDWELASGDGPTLTPTGSHWRHVFCWTEPFCRACMLCLRVGSYLHFFSNLLYSDTKKYVIDFSIS